MRTRGNASEVQAEGQTKVQIKVQAEGQTKVQIEVQAKVQAKFCQLLGFTSSPAEPPSCLLLAALISNLRLK